MAAALVGISGAGPAAAVDPPDIAGIPLVTPKDPAPAPPIKMKQSTQCAVSAQLANSVLDKPVPANAAFEVEQLHQYATGKGVKVAVIDSGVAANARLPRLVGGGDYIGTGKGLEDCDHHGTLVAGIIGAQRSPDDGFIGVAPDVSLISIRQTSSAYEPDTSGTDKSKAAGSSTLSTLARAITRAANMGAQVINLSVTACFSESQIVDTSDLAQALKYAAEVKDVVIVTSAGNANNESCKPNPGYDPDNAKDPQNWQAAHVVSMPSYYTPLVISVGGSDLTGGVYSGTMTGPWVDVAAPAVDIVSLDPTRPSGGLTNAVVGQDGTETIAGTSFAAAYVAGLAALIRERYPELGATAIRNRIVNTAHPASQTQLGAFGNGLVDPVAALTWTSADIARLDSPPSRPLPAPADAAARAWVPVAVALGTSGVVILFAGWWMAAIWLRRTSTVTKDGDEQTERRGQRAVAGTARANSVHRRRL